MYNAVADILGEKGVGFRNGAELTAGTELVGMLSNILFEILPKECLERLEIWSFRLPSLFNPLLKATYNDPARNGHKRLPQLSHADLTRMSEKLLRVRAQPNLQTNQWSNVSTAIGDLAGGLVKYCKYLDSSAQRVNVMHHQMEPARVPKRGDSDAEV